MAVQRVVDSSGYVSFAGTNYRFGNGWHRQQDAPAGASVKANRRAVGLTTEALTPTP
jgi:hypothetical protein